MTAFRAVPALLALWIVATPLAADRGVTSAVAMAGVDRSTVQLPVVGLFESYRNAGYEVRVADGRAEVQAELAPLESLDPFRLPAPGAEARTRLERLARSLTAGSATRYEAVSRILDWVARNIQYEMDRDRSQQPQDVLERRSGYCTGVARLTVQLLEAVEVPAREVPGYVFAPANGGPRGYHRWIEVRYEDRGWVFSDPLATHHYVPASYVPLASERLLPGVESDPGVLLLRRDGRHVVDRVPWAPAGVSVRRNKRHQWAGTLAIEVEGATSARAVLRGGGTVRTQELGGGRGSFLDLPPGTYFLRVEVPEQPPVWKRIVFRGAVVGTVTIPLAG